MREFNDDYWFHKRLSNLSFYGILRDFDINNITEDSVDYLKKNSIFLECNISNNQNLNIKNSNQIGVRFQFNNKVYEVSNLVREEIYYVVKDIIEIEENSFSHDIMEINFNLKKFFTIGNKIQFLKEKYISILPEEFDFGIYLEDPDISLVYGSWKALFCNELDNDIIIRYLKEDYFSLSEDERDVFSVLVPGLPWNQNLQLFEFTRKWVEYHEANEISKFILRKIKELEDKDIDEKNIPSQKKLSPLEQVCFIEKVRELGVEFDSFDYEKKLQYLNLITKGKNDDVDVQLDHLEKIITMSCFEYSKLYEKYSNVGKLLNMISGSSYDNLRLAASKYQKKIIKENLDLMHILQDMESLIKTIE